MELKDSELFEYNIIVRLHEPPDIDGWNELPTAAKAFISCISGTDETIYAKNTTTLEMHEWLVIKSDPNGTAGPEIEELAVGRSDNAVNESDTMLNDEVDRAPITSTNRETDTLRVSTFLDKAVGNVDTGAGESLSEVGLFAGEYFLNHSLLTNDIDKTDNKTATIDVLVTYDTA